MVISLNVAKKNLRSNQNGNLNSYDARKQECQSDDDMEVMKLKLDVMLDFKTSLKTFNEFKSSSHFDKNTFG